MNGIEKALKGWLGERARHPRPMVFRVHPFDILCRTPDEVEALARRATSFFAGVNGHCRMLAYTTPYPPDEVLEYVVGVARRAREEWRRRELSIYARALRRVVQESRMQRTAFYFVIWEKDAAPETVATQLSYAFEHVPVKVVEELPALLPGRYAERASYLEPASSEHPYVPCCTRTISPAKYLSRYRLPC